METSNKQTSLFTEAPSTYWLEDSHVNHTVSRERSSAKTTTVTSGRKCLEQLEKFDRVGSWAKTFTGLLIGQTGLSSKRYNLIWRLKGTKYNRIYCQLSLLERPTKEIEFGLLPTPLSRDWKGPLNKDNISKRKSPRLNDLANVGLLPTPLASDNPNKNTGKMKQDGLQKRAYQMTGKTSQLNPRYVAEMMGFPPDWTESPFQVGEINQLKDMETQ